MSKFICRVILAHARIEARASPIHRLRLIQTSHPFSSSSVVKSNPVEAQNQLSFEANYLINTCGFDPEQAISASKSVKFEASVANPDSVLAFLKNHGLTEKQIGNCIGKLPSLLLSDPEKTLLPKVQFLHSKGFSRTDIAQLLSYTPGLFQTSLANQIIPAFTLVTSLLGSKEKALIAIKRYGWLLSSTSRTHLQPNIEILQHAGVPTKNIAAFLFYHPRTFVTSTKYFQQVVEEVKEMGFNPASVNFMSAVVGLRGMSKSTWNRKVEVYMKWGWSDNEILTAFRKRPECMRASKDKITVVMDFLVNKMGYKSSAIAERPGFLCRSFKKIIVPRCAVYQVLVSKGLIKDQITRLHTLLYVSEKLFLDAAIERHKREAPELLKLYEEKLSLANLKMP